MNIQTAIERLNGSRRRLLQAIQSLGNKDLTERPIEGVWTAKDLLAHINSWEVTLLVPLRKFAQGAPWKPQVINDYLAWNDQQAMTWQEQTLEAIQTEIEATRQEILMLVKRLDAGQLGQSLTSPWGTNETIAKMLAGLAWHENEHTESIEAASK